MPVKRNGQKGFLFYVGKDLKKKIMMPYIIQRAIEAGKIKIKIAILFFNR